MSRFIFDLIYCLLGCCILCWCACCLTGFWAVGCGLSWKCFTESGFDTSLILTSAPDTSILFGGLKSEIHRVKGCACLLYRVPQKTGTVILCIPLKIIKNL